MGLMGVVAGIVNLLFSRVGKVEMNEQTIICPKGVFLFWKAVSLCLGCGGGGERIDGGSKGCRAALHCGEGEEELLEQTKVLDARRGDSARLQHSLVSISPISPT